MKVIDDIKDMRKYSLMTELGEEKTEEEIKELANICVICDEPIQLRCCSPKIKWSGLGVGFRTPEATWIESRHAHLSCFIKDNIEWIREVLDENNEV